MSDARGEIGKALETRLDPEQIRLLLDEVLAIKKQVWANCPSCKKRAMFEIPDAKAVTGSLLDLANQAWGRPDVAQTQEDEKIRFDYVTEWGCENCSCVDCVRDRGEAASA